MLEHLTHRLRGAIDRWQLRRRPTPLQADVARREDLQRALQTERDFLVAWAQAARAKLEFLATTTHDAEVIALVQTCPLRRREEE